MALAVQSCFRSCVSCKSHMAKVIRHPEGQYKIIKAIYPIFDIIGEIARSFQASEATQRGITYGRDSVKRVSNLLGFIHTFTSIIPSFACSLKLFWELAKGLVTESSVQLHPFKSPSELEFCEIAKGKSEKFLCLGLISAKAIKNSSAASAFFLRPFANAVIYREMLFVKHTSGLIGHALEVGYNYMAFQRALGEGIAFECAYKIFEQRIIEQAVALIEKSLQLLYDIALIFQQVPPTWFRLPLLIAIAGLSLYRVWLKTL